VASPAQSSRDPNFLKAFDYHKAGQYDRALKGYRRLLKQNPTDLDALLLAGQASFQAGRQQDAVRMLRQAASHHPADPRPPYNLGVIFQAAGDTHNALAVFETAARLGPGFAPAHYNLALALHEVGRSEDSLQPFERAVQIDPNHADAHASKAFVLRGLGRMEEARAAYETAARLAPGNAKTLTGLGITYQELGRLDDALAVYRKAILADPDYPDATSNLADALVQMDRPGDAIEACDIYLTHHPASAGVLASKAIALNDAGRNEELGALADLRQLVRVFDHEAPAGFPDIAAFNGALARHVLNHPTLISSPASHATRDGKHTGSLNEGSKGPVAAFEKLVHRGVQHYLDALGDDNPHPVIRHRPDRYNLAIWAVVLEGKGYQLPHIHPSGWLSGVYYVRVPKVAERGGSEGWIEFGQPGPEYHFSVEPPLRLVKPQPGTMVLFPSFVFHRTIPFQCDETRISVAFDVVPA